MRKPLLAFLLLASLMLSLTGVASAASDDQKFFDDNIGKLVTLKVKEITSPALPKISAARFFSIDIVVNDGWNTVVVARMNDDVSQVTIPSSDADMPDFKKLIKPDYTLKSDEDAHLLQDALDILYPVTDANDTPVKTIKHTGNTWTFVRGKFFDHFKAFIVTTDDSGKVTSVKWSLNS